MKRVVIIGITVILISVFGAFMIQEESTEEVKYPSCIESFPVITRDSNDKIWMANIERIDARRMIRINQVTGEGRINICSLEPDPSTGIAPPVIDPFEKGCIIVFPVERNDRWQIGYVRMVNGNSPNPEIKYIESEGNSNINPSVATSGKSAWIVWESNAGNFRGIYACMINKDGPGRITYISSPDVNCYNPSIIALQSGELLAVWDSFREKSSDIYGSWYRNGKWQKEQRFTSDARIERHPFLTTRRDEVWMTWQAQSYGHTVPMSDNQKRMRLNHVEEQRIVVAKIEKDNLFTPNGFFEFISTNNQKLLRPRIGIDPSGKLWLTARESMGQLKGWKPVVWKYENDQWSDKISLFEQQGRWNPVNFAVLLNELLFAIQYDNLPDGWGADRRRGMPNWESGIVIKSIILEDTGEDITLKTEVLNMPETKFSLPEKIKLCGADLPRQKVRISDKELTLFWGSLHEHSAISICQRASNPPGHDLFANERDIEKLDFCALTDHGSDIDRYIWDYNGEQTRNNYDPGRFITFLALEWASSMHLKSKGYGHFNLIYLDPYFSEYYDNNYDDITPSELWGKIGNAEFISIPHQLADWDHMVKFNGENGNPPVDWNYVDEKLQPVAEIFQLRESYEYFGSPRQAPKGAPFQRYYIQDAWARGIIIGVIASPDHGGGIGKAGVWAEDLTRESIFKAIQARNTFGTSGEKISLFFQSGKAIMGDKVKWNNEPITFNIKAVALNPVKELVIFRNNEVVYRIEPNQKEIEMQWTDENPVITKYAWYQKNHFWYYVRIQTEDEELAWSSPIWFLE